MNWAGPGRKHPLVIFIITPWNLHKCCVDLYKTTGRIKLKRVLQFRGMMWSKEREAVRGIQRGKTHSHAYYAHTHTHTHTVQLQTNTVAHKKLHTHTDGARMISPLSSKIGKIFLILLLLLQCINIPKLQLLVCTCVCVLWWTGDLVRMFYALYLLDTGHKQQWGTNLKDGWMGSID